MPHFGHPFSYSAPSSVLSSIFPFHLSSCCPGNVCFSFCFGCCSCRGNYVVPSFFFPPLAKCGCREEFLLPSCPYIVLLPLFSCPIIFSGLFGIGFGFLVLVFMISGFWTQSAQLLLLPDSMETPDTCFFFPHYINPFLWPPPHFCFSNGPRPLGPFFVTPAFFPNYKS